MSALMARTVSLLSAARRRCVATSAGVPASSTPASQRLIELEDRYSARNYAPYGVVFAAARGARVTDADGATYVDLLSAYSAVNQGHAHPRIVRALAEQAGRCTLSSRAFRNDVYPSMAEALCERMGYEKVLAMNTGAEAVETGVKLARKWAYTLRVPTVPYGEAVVVSMCGCFHRRTAAAIAMSCDPTATYGFGPHQPGHAKAAFGDLASLGAVMDANAGRVAAVLVEPVQGEGGVIVPPEGYLQGVRQLCDRHGALLVCDEVQTGLGRCGAMSASASMGARADVLLLGKALGGGVYPVSAVLADDRVMAAFQPGEHGSTFGANPLASAVALASLDVLAGEGLPERAAALGPQLLEGLREAAAAAPPGLVTDVRGLGLLAAVEFARGRRVGAADAAAALRRRGFLAKPTQGTVLRLAPPLVISEEDLAKAVQAIRGVLSEDLPELEAAREAADNSAASPAGGAQTRQCERCGKQLDV